MRVTTSIKTISFRYDFSEGTNGIGGVHSISEIHFIENCLIFGVLINTLVNLGAPAAPTDISISVNAGTLFAPLSSTQFTSVLPQQYLFGLQPVKIQSYGNNPPQLFINADDIPTGIIIISFHYTEFPQ